MPRLLLTCVAALLAACGQTGPLYLPDEGISTPVETRGPATATPEAATPPLPAGEPAEPDDEDDPPSI